MSGHFLKYDPCPRCRERGKDSRGDNLAVYKDGSAHCFSCSYHTFPGISDIWRKKDEEIEEHKTKRIIPYDFTTEVPAKCWQWLLQFGLPYSYWLSIVGWSESTQRLVFRVGSPVNFSVGRLLLEKSLLGDSKRKWNVWGDSHSSVAALGTGRQCMVLVEDILSAHKVAQGTQTIPLFGTRIYPKTIKYLREQEKPIIVWLDKDQEDTMPAVCTRLSLLTGQPVRYIVTDKDPKYYTVSEIQEILK